MEIYNGIIKEDFLKAEIEFAIELPEFCEDQDFELYEERNGEDHQILEFALLLNSRSAIVESISGVVTYTGPIDPTEIETTVIGQYGIEKSEVANFHLRKFKLKVL